MSNLQQYFRPHTSVIFSRGSDLDWWQYNTPNVCYLLQFIPPESQVESLLSTLQRNHHDKVNQQKWDSNDSSDLLPFRCLIKEIFIHLFKSLHVVVMSQHLFSLHMLEIMGQLFSPSVSHSYFFALRISCGKRIIASFLVS